MLVDTGMMAVHVWWSKCGKRNELVVVAASLNGGYKWIVAGTIASIGLKFSDSATFKREALLLLILPRINIIFVTCMVEKRARG